MFATFSEMCRSKFMHIKRESDKANVAKFLKVVNLDKHSSILLWKYPSKFEKKNYMHRFSLKLYLICTWEGIKVPPSTTLSGFYGWGYVALPFCLNHWNFHFDFVLLRRVLITFHRCEVFVVVRVNASFLSLSAPFSPPLFSLFFLYCFYVDFWFTAYWSLDEVCIISIRNYWDFYVHMDVINLCKCSICIWSILKECVYWETEFTNKQLPDQI